MNPTGSEETKKKIAAVLRPRLRLLDPAQPIPPDADLGELGLDSMAAIDLLLDLEQALHIKIPDSLLTAETFQTAASLERTILPLTVQQP
jgi:acyl carrier protein